MSDILTRALEEQNTLCHHGILGQKWGVRRYQNPDGSLTEAGKKRYDRDNSKYESIRSYKKKLNDEASSFEKGKVPTELRQKMANLNKVQRALYKKIQNKYGRLPAYDQVHKEMYTEMDDAAVKASKEAKRLYRLDKKDGYKYDYGDWYSGHEKTKRYDQLKKVYDNYDEECDKIRKKYNSLYPEFVSKNENYNGLVLDNY